MRIPSASIEERLSAEEWALVSALRTIPDSPLRQRVTTLLQALVEFAGEPKCRAMQGDGVPCGAVDTQCDQCLHVSEWLDELTARTVRAFGTNGSK